MEHPGVMAEARHPAASVGWGRWIWRTLVLVGVVQGLIGCRTLDLPPVNLSQPGWEIRNGQAVWHRDKGKFEMAGELTIGWRGGVEAFVEFTKTPVPILTAQVNRRGWQATFVPENRTFSAPGHPPKRLLFLHLPRALKQGNISKKLRFEAGAEGSFVLENPATGERIEGYLAP